jgi:hypothetical protein
MSKRLADMHLSGALGLWGSGTLGFRGSYYLTPYFSRTSNWRTLARYIFGASGLCYFGASGLWNFGLQKFHLLHTSFPPNVELVNSWRISLELHASEVLASIYSHLLTLIVSQVSSLQVSQVFHFAHKCHKCQESILP